MKTTEKNEIGFAEYEMKAVEHSGDHLDIILDAKYLFPIKQALTKIQDSSLSIFSDHKVKQTVTIGYSKETDWVYFWNKNLSAIFVIGQIKDK
jgi:hypothetical protein